LSDRRTAKSTPSITRPVATVVVERDDSGAREVSGSDWHDSRARRGLCAIGTTARQKFPKKR
jgi:hypothetical protein